MFSKVAFVATLFAVAHAGHEAPPAKAHAYSVPSVAKVSYPAPTITKSVETYSAPSIEKTTTITRTITAPLNAPPVKSIQYSAPPAPVVVKSSPTLYAAPSFGAAPGVLSQKGYSAPAVLSVQSLGYGAQPLFAAYAAPQGLNLATTYGSPSLGYSLGNFGGNTVALKAAAPVYTSEYGH
ncbi:hypothetical protein Ocin01_02543 [Orchesella cincta]|uniref:Uncharacterized protein n=1 Tax=Orchesella cincta TaxID=48709 RepID=A0A1D2NFT8_ORCCI|nr:hypothetical protein Ocin01_02543 [Orchesella cincta]